MNNEHYVMYMDPSIPPLEIADPPTPPQSLSPNEH